MEIALLVALVGSYAVFLLFTFYVFKQIKDERAELLNRIQAPEIAPLEIMEIPDTADELMSIEFDDDEAHAALRVDATS